MQNNVCGALSFVLRRGCLKSVFVFACTGIQKFWKDIYLKWESSDYVSVMGTEWMGLGKRRGETFHCVSFLIFMARTYLT